MGPDAFTSLGDYQREGAAESMDGDVFGLDSLNRMPAMPVILPHHRLPAFAVRRRVGHQPRRHAHCLDPARKAQRQREEPVMERSASQAREFAFD